jgi:hypothetical protein
VVAPCPTQLSRGARIEPGGRRAVAPQRPGYGFASASIGLAGSAVHSWSDAV